MGIEHLQRFGSKIFLQHQTLGQQTTESLVVEQFLRVTEDMFSRECCERLVGELRSMRSEQLLDGVDGFSPVIAIAALSLKKFLKECCSLDSQGADIVLVAQHEHREVDFDILRVIFVKALILVARSIEMLDHGLHSFWASIIVNFNDLFVCFLISGQ